MAKYPRARAGYETLAAELKAGTIHSVYLFWGEEAFLVARATKEVIRAVLGERDPGLGLVRWDPQIGSLADALRDVEELSLLGQRVVVFDGITSRDNWGYAKLHVKKAERDRLARYVRDPNPSSVLILTGAVADYGQRFLTDLAPAIHLYHLGAPDDERLARWASSKATALGFRLSAEAVTTLVASSRGSMLKLATEIEKLALFLEPSATASAGDVLALSEGSSEDNVYEITNALASGDAATAIQTLRRVVALHSDGEVRIVSELRRVLMLWFRIREALERGLKPQEMATELQLAPYVLQRNLPSAQRFSISFLGELLARLCELERSMKGGEGESRVAIELLVLDAARAALPARRPLGTGA